MQIKYKETMKIRTYEVDASNRLRPENLFNYMQEAAGTHANELGFGYKNLTQNNMYWVLSRARIDMKRYPEWGESVSLETWPSGVDRLFALRDFIFRDEKGEIIGDAVTAWLILDGASLRPQRMNSLPFEFPEGIPDNIQERIPGKLDTAADMSHNCIRAAEYSDIDINQHVNNARYIEWVTDCLMAKGGSAENIRSLQINFLSETKLGDTVNIGVTESGCEGGWPCIVEGIKGEGNKKVFQCGIEWMKR